MERDLPLTPQQRSIALTRGLVFLDEFIKISPDMPVLQIRLFLLIASFPGNTIAYYARLIDLPASGGTVNRHFAALRVPKETEKFSHKKRLRSFGSGLIETYSDPNDMRNLLARPSKKGEKLLDRLVSYIWGGGQVE